MVVDREQQASQSNKICYVWMGSWKKNHEGWLNKCKGKLPFLRIVHSDVNFISSKINAKGQIQFVCQE